MADPFGRREPGEEAEQGTATDYLGAEAPVAFEGQPALPVSGGAAIGSPTAPVTAGGFAPTAPSTATGQETTTSGPFGGGGGGGDEDGGGVAGALAQIGSYVQPGLKLLNLAQKLMAPPAPYAAGATETPSGQFTTSAPEILRDLQYPDAAGAGPSGAFSPGDFSGALLGSAPTAGGELASVPGGFTLGSGEAIPDDIINLFGGQEAFQGALSQASVAVSPDQVAAMADAGQLTGMGIESSAGLTPDQLSSIGTGLGIASLIVTGLRMGGVLEGDAATVVSSMLGLASGALSISQFVPALVNAGIITAETATTIGSTAAPVAMSTLGTVGALAGGVTAFAAPFIAWGMNELAMRMRPNVTPIKRQLDEKIYNAVAGDVRSFTEAVAMVREAGLTDPAILQQLLNAGEQSVLNFYQVGVDVGGQGETRGGGYASASGQVGGFPVEQQGAMMAPFQQAMQELQWLDAQLGGTARGSNAWYGIFGGQLNPWSLSGDTSPLGLSAGQYEERFTPEQLRAAAGGVDPLDFAFAQWGVAPMPPQDWSRGQVVPSVPPPPGDAP